MLYSYTWDSICDLARLYADERVAGFLSNAEVSTIARSKAQMVMERALQLGHNGFIIPLDETQWDVSSSGASLTLSNLGIGEGAGVKQFLIKWDTTDWEVVPAIEEREIPRYKLMTWGRHTPKGFILSGKYNTTPQVTLYPTPTEDFTYVVHYVDFTLPETVAYGASKTVRGCPTGFKELVALETAIAIRAMQDEDTRGLESQLARSMRMFDASCGQDLLDSPRRVVDVNPDSPTYWDELYLPKA